MEVSPSYHEVFPKLPRGHYFYIFFFLSHGCPMTGCADLCVDFVAGLRRLHLLRDLGAGARVPMAIQWGNQHHDDKYVPAVPKGSISDDFRNHSGTPWVVLVY